MSPKVFKAFPFLFVAMVIVAQFSLFSCQKASRKNKYVIGFSQVTVKEPGGLCLMTDLSEWRIV